MFNLTKSDIQRVTVSTVGALALSAASIFGAVAPVKAASPQAATVADWRGAVERQIGNGAESGLASTSDRKVGLVTVALQFTADGDFAHASIARSSGNKVIDARAIETARDVAFPTLPEAMRGTPQTITMNLYYGRNFEAVEQAQRAAKTQDRQFVTGRSMQLAAR